MHASRIIGQQALPTTTDASHAILARRLREGNRECIGLEQQFPVGGFSAADLNL